MALSREKICRATGAKLAAAASSVSSIKAVIGLDGFVDEIIAVVDTRLDKQHYQPVQTIAHWAAKIAKAAGESSNYELVVKQMKLGGNGPIMANALAYMGMDVAYVGNLGYPTLHSVFADFAKRAKVTSIAEPGHTDALEFEDGKLMLGKHGSLQDVNWENLTARLGAGGLTWLVDSARLIGMVNWTMLPFMSDIWARMIEEVMPKLHPRQRTLFVDLADPEKRTCEDILDALKLLTQFQDHVEVILGLNLKEAVQVAHVLKISPGSDPEAAIEATAAAIRAAFGLGCVVIHPRKGAAAATKDASAAFVGPFVAQPKISTGAGDHFNAGFCLGRILGFSLDESLCTGVAASGYYVRTAESPSVGQLADFAAKLPPPQ